MRRDLRRLALEHAVASEAVGSPWSGRWGLLHRAGVLGPARSADDLASAHVQVLLHRHGVIARELIAREDGPFDWVTLSAHLARMEMRGEVRRGFFIAGLSGQQYALPDAVEQLRAAAAGSPADTPLVVLNATDPAQVYGVAHGGTPAAPAAETPDTEPGAEGVPRFARIPSTHLVLHHGTVLLLSEDGGERLWTPGDLSVESARNAVAALLARPAAPRRAVVRLWNGEPALGGLAQEILRPLGFSRAPGGLERWAPPG